MHFKTAIASGLVLAGGAMVRADHEYSSSSGGGYEAGYGAGTTTYSKTTSAYSTKATAAAQSSGAYSSYSSAYTSAYASPYASSYASSSWSKSASASASAPAASGSAGTKVHVVKVGGPNGELTFSPAEIKAQQGDVVQFQFYPRVRSPHIPFTI
jgi:plastocyanin